MALERVYIGQMDSKIKIYEFTKEQNEIGEEKETKELVASPFAFVEDAGGAESVDGKVMHTTNRSYTIRWNSKVKCQGVHYIVEDEGTEFLIQSVQRIGRKKFLKLTVSNYE